MPEQENARMSQPKKSQQIVQSEKETNAVPERKRQRRPLVNAATTLGTHSSTDVVINPEEDSAGLRRVGPLVDLGGQEQGVKEERHASNRELVLENPEGPDDLSDVSGTVELTTEQELLRAAGLDFQTENWFGRD